MTETAITATTARREPDPITTPGPILVEFLRKNPTCSVNLAAKVLGVSRAFAYELAKSGELDAIKLGQKRFRVKSAALLKLIGAED